MDRRTLPCRGQPSRKQGGGNGRRGHRPQLCTTPVIEELRQSRLIPPESQRRSRTRNHPQESPNGGNATAQHRRRSSGRRHPTPPASSAARAPSSTNPLVRRPRLLSVNTPASPHDDRDSVLPAKPCPAAMQWLFWSNLLPPSPLPASSASRGISAPPSLPWPSVLHRRPALGMEHAPVRRWHSPSGAFGVLRQRRGSDALVPLLGLMRPLAAESGRLDALLDPRHSVPLPHPCSPANIASPGASCAALERRSAHSLALPKTWAPATTLLTAASVPITGVVCIGLRGSASPAAGSSGLRV